MKSQLIRILEPLAMPGWAAAAITIAVEASGACLTRFAAASGAADSDRWAP